MDTWTDEREAAFDAYVEALVGVIGHADRAEPLKDYCLGLLMPVERKSVEPLAAVIAPSRVAAKHQSLLHFVGQAPWSDEALMGRVRDWVLPRIEQRGAIRAWIIDDTGFPKKGKHSVGVARQYCGQLGKQDNCQVAVSLSVANDAASLPIAWRLYLPQVWADDPERRRKAKIPDDITFKTKPQIALDQIKAAKAQGIAPGVILADAGYGADGGFRAGLTQLALTYVVGVQPTLSVWRPGEGPLPPKPWSGKGRPTSRLRRDADHQPVSAKTLAETLAAEAWHTVAWREGTNAELSSRFAAVRLRPASRDVNRSETHEQEWLLIEWPEDESAPTKYWLSTLPPDTSITQLVDTAKLRWRIERDYQELKHELGLGHYEGRSWRGFHHHASLCIAAYGFLISLRETIPPSAPPQTRRRQVSGLPDGFRPRGSAGPARATRPNLNPDPATTTERRPGNAAPTVSMLQKGDGQSQSPFGKSPERDIGLGGVVIKLWMWTAQSRGRMAQIAKKTKRYPSDLTDEEWDQIAPLMPKPGRRGRPREVDFREVINAVRYLVRSGCGWRMLPIHFGPWQTVYGWFRELSRRFLFQTIHNVALMVDRERAGREASPSAAVIDSQSVKAPQAKTRGYDAGKKIVGRKRHIAVDTDGRLLMVNLTTADISDNAGGQMILEALRKRWPWVKHLFADGAYDRLQLMDKAAYLEFVVEIIRRSDGQKGFEVLPRRWVVERTFGSMTRWRRLVRDYEQRIDVSHAMILVAMGGNLIRRNAHP